MAQSIFGIATTIICANYAYLFALDLESAKALGIIVTELLLSTCTAHA